MKRRDPAVFNPINPSPALPCSRWLSVFDQEPAGWPALREIYGGRPDLVRGKIDLIRRILRRFLETFGDLPVRLYRAPGRVNLRGMHVDTHGGWLNLIAHHGETIAVVARTGDPVRRYVNLEPENPTVAFSLKPFAACLESLKRSREPHDPAALTGLAEVAGGIAGLPAWGRYVLGTALAARFHGAATPDGLRVAVGSDLVWGASLSSSASLCVATLLAEWDSAGNPPSIPSLLHGARQAEWFAGARVGLSDQAAVALARQDAVLHTALGGPDLFPEPPVWHPIPEDVSVVVIHTFTRRSLSGAGRVAYAINRFAYSMALRLLEHAAIGIRPEGGPFRFQTFPEVLAAFPENRDRLRLIRLLPETLDLAALEQLCGSQSVQPEHARLFGDLPEAERPVRFSIRGPVLFGLAETLRARCFFEALRAGDLKRMGTLARAGHDGDRIIDAEGHPFRVSADDATLQRWLAENRPLETCPGAYGASTPALDMAVDAALSAGAAGACLTGAGLGGAVVALCRKTETERIRDGVLRRLNTEAFQRARGPEAPPWPSDAARAAVVENIALPGAGPVPPPEHPGDTHARH